MTVKTIKETITKVKAIMVFSVELSSYVAATKRQVRAILSWKDDSEDIFAHVDNNRLMIG